MGLDNSLKCKNFPFKSFRGEPVDNTGRIEICYWGKCWNFRNEVMDYLIHHKLIDGYEGFCSSPLSVFQLEDIREILEKYTHLDYVEKNNNETIWEPKDTVKYMANNLENLDTFIPIMKESPGLVVFFYDSY